MLIFFFICKQEIQICTLVWPSIAGEIVWDVTFATVFFLIPGLVIVISYSKILQVCFSFKFCCRTKNKVNSNSLGINILSLNTNTSKGNRHNLLSKW